MLLSFINMKGIASERKKEKKVNWQKALISPYKKCAACDCDGELHKKKSFWISIYKSYSQRNIMRAIARRRGTQSREGKFFYAKWHQTANINDLTAHSPR